MNQGSQVDRASLGARAEPGEQAEPVATAAEAAMELQEVAAAMAVGAAMEAVPDQGSDRVTGREKGDGAVWSRTGNTGGTFSMIASG